MSFPQRIFAKPGNSYLDKQLLDIMGSWNKLEISTKRKLQLRFLSNNTRSKKCILGNSFVRYLSHSSSTKDFWRHFNSLPPTNFLSLWRNIFIRLAMMSLFHGHLCTLRLSSFKYMPSKCKKSIGLNKLWKRWNLDAVHTWFRFFKIKGKLQPAKFYKTDTKTEPNQWQSEVFLVQTSLIRNTTSLEAWHFASMSEVSIISWFDDSDPIDEDS